MVVISCRKGELGLSHRETFVPQSYSWGVEGQVDWYKAFADITGERTKVYVFCMRSMEVAQPFIAPTPQKLHSGWRSRLSKRDLSPS